MSVFLVASVFPKGNLTSVDWIYPLMDWGNSKALSENVLLCTLGSPVVNQCRTISVDQSSWPILGTILFSAILPMAIVHSHYLLPLTKNQTVSEHRQECTVVLHITARCIMFVNLTDVWMRCRVHLGQNSIIYWEFVIGHKRCNNSNYLLIHLYPCWFVFFDYYFRSMPTATLCTQINMLTSMLIHLRQ